MVKQRIAWIDTSKALGVILVIYGHISLCPNALNVWLCSFHMPLFFFLSGVTINIEKLSNFKMFFINKFKTLIIPYFIFSAVNWLWTALFNILLSFKE